MRPIADAASSLAFQVVTLLFAPTLIMLLVRRFVPVVGQDLWRLYWRALRWLLIAPFRLIRLMAGEVVRALRR